MLSLQLVWLDLVVYKDIGSFCVLVSQIVQEQRQRRLVKHLLAMVARISKFVLLLPKDPIQVHISCISSSIREVEIIPTALLR